MTTRQFFIRMVIYGVVLGALDAALGRTLQASTDVSFLLLLLAGAWIGFTLGAMQRLRAAAPAALTFFGAFMLTYAAVAYALVGWNNSVPWQAHPGEIAYYSIAVAIVAFLFARLAARARAKQETRLESQR